MEVLRVENLCKVYGKGETRVEALKNVSFSMEKGEFAAVVGESGSGKSTLLHCIGGLEQPSSGHVYLDGRDLFAPVSYTHLQVWAIGKPGEASAIYTTLPGQEPVKHCVCLLYTSRCV